MLLDKNFSTHHGLHPSHKWWINDDGDCYHGLHTLVYCYGCDEEAFVEGVCYYEIRYNTTYPVNPWAKKYCFYGDTLPELKDDE